MIERAGEHVFDYTLHGGNGSVRMQWHFLDTSRLPVAVQTWELPPGASEGTHAHDAVGRGEWHPWTGVRRQVST